MYETCVCIANGWLFGVLLVNGGYSVHHETIHNKCELQYVVLLRPHNTFNENHYTRTYRLLLKVNLSRIVQSEPM